MPLFRSPPPPPPAPLHQAAYFQVEGRAERILYSPSPPPPPSPPPLLPHPVPPSPPSPPPFAPAVFSFEGPFFAPDAFSRNLFRGLLLACFLLLLLLLLRCFRLFRQTADRVRQGTVILAEQKQFAQTARAAQASIAMFEAKLSKIKMVTEKLRAQQRDHQKRAEQASMQAAFFAQSPEYLQAVEDTEDEATLAALDAAIANEEDTKAKWQLVMLRLAATDWVRAALWLPRCRPSPELSTEPSADASSQANGTRHDEEQPSVGQLLPNPQPLPHPNREGYNSL